jgi:serine protease Do
MKRIMLKRFVIAGLAFLTVPSIVLAQREKEKENQKTENQVKDKKEVKTIVITCTDDKDEKMTIVVDGEKITVNGKDVKDLKDVNVNVNTSQGFRVFGVPGGQNSWSRSFNNDDQFSMYHEDSNIAMLGVNTEDDAKGARIESVNEASGAEKAGLKKGDIITKVGDNKIEDAGDLTKAVREHKPGEKVAITYLRNGKEQKVTVELTKWKGLRAMEPLKMEKIMTDWNNTEPTRAYGMQGNPTLYSGRPKLGLSIEDTDDGKGVKVLEVDEESNAAKAGIKKDDIILSIDDKEVKGIEDVVRTVRQNKEKYNFTFKVQRNGKLQNIEVKFPKKLKTTDL